MPLLRGEARGWEILFSFPHATLNDGEVAEASGRPRRPVEDLGLPNLPGNRDKSSLGRGDSERRTTESSSVRSAAFSGTRAGSQAEALQNASVLQVASTDFLNSKIAPQPS